MRGEAWADTADPLAAFGERSTRDFVRRRHERSKVRELVQTRWRRSREVPFELTPSCESDRPGVLVVAHSGDLVAHMVSTFLRYDDIPVWDVSPHRLADLQYQVRRDAIYLQGSPIGGVMLRWSRCDEGPTSSQHCGDPLVIASWLAAADLGRTRVVNNYDAESWRGGTGWAVWEHRLSESGVPTLEAGRIARGMRQSLVACGEIIDGPADDSIHETREVLLGSGVQLATVFTLEDGTVAGVDTQPDVTDAAAARHAAVAIIDHMTAHAS